MLVIYHCDSVLNQLAAFSGACIYCLTLWEAYSIRLVLVYIK